MMRQSLPVPKKTPHRHKSVLTFRDGKVDIPVGCEVDKLGLTFCSLPPGSVSVRTVLPDLWAGHLGIIPGDIVMAVNGRSVLDLPRADFMRMLQERPLTFTLGRMNLVASQAKPNREPPPKVKRPKGQSLAMPEASHLMNNKPSLSITTQNGLLPIFEAKNPGHEADITFEAKSYKPFVANMTLEAKNPRYSSKITTPHGSTTSNCCFIFLSTIPCIITFWPSLHF